MLDSNFLITFIPLEVDDSPSPKKESPVLEHHGSS